MIITSIIHVHLTVSPTHSVTTGLYPRHVEHIHVHTSMLHSQQHYNKIKILGKVVVGQLPWFSAGQDLEGG